MRILSFKSAVLVLIASTLFPFSASLAQTQRDAVRTAGPSGTGGGHWIESGFRTKTEQIFNYMDEMSAEGKRLLKFDPSEVLNNMAIPGRFQVRCVSENSITQIFLLQKNKIAYVGAEGAGINEISLDCARSRENTWKELFKSEDVGAHIFFIHEALRNNNINSETENDYLNSGSYRAAYKANGILVSREIKGLVTNQYTTRNETADCVFNVSVGLYGETFSATALAHLFQGGKLVATYEFPKLTYVGYSKESVTVEALAPNSKLGSWVYNKAKLFNCKLKSDRNQK